MPPNQLSPRHRLCVRVSRLETITERLSKAQTDLASALPPSNSTSSRESPPHGSRPNRKYSLVDLAELEQESQSRAPLFSLFDNDVLLRKPKESSLPVTSTSISFTAVHMSDRDKLLSTIAQEPNVLDVLDLADSWFIAWFTQYPGMKDLDIARSLRDYATYHLQQERPLMVAIGLLCVSMSLQHVRPGVDDTELHLASSVNDLKERILVAVDVVALANESYVLSLEGVLALLMRAKIHAESNQLRKCWLRIRQAILTGQEIKMAAPQFGLTQADLIHRQRFLGGLFENDRSLSMVLGLPYAVDDNFTDRLAYQALTGEEDFSVKMRALRRVTAIAAGRVNDRNAMPEIWQQDTSTKIQETLTTVGISMPNWWWDVPSLLRSIRDPQIAHEHLMAQLWYFQVQTFLQLPFFVKAVASETDLEYHSRLCLDGARNLLKIYHVFSQNPSLSAYTCKCEDFQGLLAACVLVIGLLQHASQTSNIINHQYQHDLDLLDATKAIFQYQSQQQGGSIAKQGLHVLNTLTSFLQDMYCSEQSQGILTDANLFIPYFGTVTVQPNPTAVLRAEPNQISQAQLPTPVSSDHSISGESTARELSNLPSSATCSGLGPASIVTGQPEQSMPDLGWICSPSQSALGWLDLSGTGSNPDELLFGKELDLDWNDFATEYSDTQTVNPVDVMKS